MEHFRRIGVFLRGAVPDDTVTAYAARMGLLGNVDAFVFMYVPHVIGYEPESTFDAAALEAAIRGRMPGSSAAVEVLEFRDGGVADILRTARDRELDLIITGRSLPSAQTAAAALFTRLARKSPCSVLAVPEQVRPHIRRMLVPVDLSDHSRNAVERAIELARLCAEDGRPPQIVVVSVFSVGYGYHLSGATFAEAARNIEDATRRNLDAFTSSLDTAGVDLELVTLCSEQPERVIVEFASARKMDMVVVGSRGMSTAAAVVLGSFAEHVLQSCSLPVLVVKQKGETTSLLNALLG